MQDQFNGGNVVFSTKGTGVIDHPQAQKEILLISIQNLYILYKNELRMDYRLTCKHKSIKLWGNNLKENLWDLGLGQMFLQLTQKSQSIKTDKLSLSKLKTFAP